eukprot:1827431-Rhodomonas_salina.1
MRATWSWLWSSIKLETPMWQSPMVSSLWMLWAEACSSNLMKRRSSISETCPSIANFGRQTSGPLWKRASERLKRKRANKGQHMTRTASTSN